MRIPLYEDFVFLALALFVTGAHAQTSPKWELIANTSELNMLIKGKALGGKDWIFYFRGDGKLGSMQYGSITIREWTVTDKGEICYAVFSMPDKIIRCETIEKVNTPSPKYRMMTNFGTFEFEIKNPPAELVNAIVDRAGPE